MCVYRWNSPRALLIRVYLNMSRSGISFVDHSRKHGKKTKWKMQTEERKEKKTNNVKQERQWRAKNARGTRNTRDYLIVICFRLLTENIPLARYSLYRGCILCVYVKKNKKNPTAFYEFEGERCIFLWTKLLAQCELTLNWKKKNKWKKMVNWRWVFQRWINPSEKCKMQCFVFEMDFFVQHSRSQINALRWIKSIYQLELRFSVPYCIFCANTMKSIMFIDRRSHWFSRFESPFFSYEWKKNRCFLFLSFWSVHFKCKNNICLLIFIFITAPVEHWRIR